MVAEDVELLSCTMPHHALSSRGSLPAWFPLRCQSRASITPLDNPPAKQDQPAQSGHCGVT